MTSRPMIIPAAIKLTPLRQGDSDSLCGLYSIINGIRLALHPKVKLTRTQVRSLFVHGLEALSRSKRLPAVLASGISETAWMRLCDNVIDHASHLTGHSVRRSYVLRGIQGLDSRGALSLLRRELRNGRPLVLLLWGAYDHCSVAVGYSASRLVLFDSHNLRWIELRSVGLHHARSTKRHKIAKRSAIALWLADLKPEELPPRRD